MPARDPHQQAKSTTGGGNMWGDELNKEEWKCNGIGILEFVLEFEYTEVLESSRVPT